MTLLEKISCISDKTLRLYKEGVFWIAYNEDAFRLCAIKKLRPSRRYVKSIKQEVFSVGFPTASLQGIKECFDVLEETDLSICMAASDVDIQFL